MIVRNLIQKMHRRYAGDSKYPTEGGSEWLMYLEIANDLKNDWATDPEIDSASNWEERTFGTVSSVTDLSHGLDDDVAKLSDFVYIDCVDGRTVCFTVIKLANRHNRTDCAFQSGAGPISVNFTNIPLAAVGGTIRAGVYVVPDDMKNGSDSVPVDRPEWVVVAGAAQLAFNDPSKEDKYPDLQGEANDEYQKMASAAASLPENQPESVPIVGFDDPASDGDC